MSLAFNATAAGTWAPLAHPPPAGLNNSLLLSDGTVICGDGGSGWYRLTPDIHGSYVNGTWNPIASSHYTRLFYSSDVLTNGYVYVAGGEYGSGRDRAELYNPLNDTWTEIPRPTSSPIFSDAVSKILPNGSVLQGTTGGNVWIYNPNLNTITAGPSARNQNEACWVKLTNDCILTIDAFGTQSEHYVPSLNTWINDSTVPVSLYGYGGEMGAGFVLPNGNVFYIGGTTHTAIYTPGSSVSAAGTWVAGPEMVFGGVGFGAVDAPAAMMVNGKILCALGTTNGFGSTTSFYEYDYVANSFSQVNGPTGLTLNTAPFTTTMLQLPDGGIFYIAGQGSTQTYIYTPDGTPLAAGQPAINSITQNADGSYQLAGTGLNGISGGAAYGDDWQMDSNYPLIRMTNLVTGNIYYARSYRWNSTSVMTGNRLVTTEFSLQPTLPIGSYSLVVSANGNLSAPTTFNYFPPPAPTGLNAIIGDTQLGLSWNAVSGATTYNVLRTTRSGLYYTTVATITGTNYTDTGLLNGVTYYYVVTAVGSSGPSPYSSELAATPFGAPAVPTGLIAIPAGYVGVSLSWNSVPGAMTYNVKRSTTSGGPYTIIANRANPDCTDTNVSAGTTYYYVVSAVSAGGESANSVQSSATPGTTGDILSGLAANWRFDDGAGTTAVDSSGNNNTGTLLNSPTWVLPGRIGAAELTFNQTNLQSVTANNSASLNPSSAITIAAWINPVDWLGNRRIVQKGNSDNQYRLLAEGNVLKFHLNGVGTLTTALPTSNIWTHVAATWNGSTMLIYTNGQAQGSLTAGGSITATTDPVAIGKKNTSSTSGDYWNGQLDEVRLYNRALSLAEINIIAHNGDVPPTAPTGLSAVPTNSQVTLSWNASSAASSYNIKRANVNGGPYTTVGTSFSPTYTDGALTNGTTYYYVVSALNYTNESPNSSQVTVRPGIGAVFFANVGYSGTASQVLAAGTYTLAQLAAAGVANDTASSCRIPSGWTAIIYQNDGFSGTSWTLTSDTPNFTAYSGLNDAMSSCRLIAPALPAIPGNLAATAGDTQVALNWNTSSGASAYNVKRSLTSGGPYALVATTTGTNYTDTAVLNGATYYYVVSAANISGESAASSQVAATPFASPILLTVISATNNQFTLQFQAVNGRTYIVLTSTDLAGWTPIYTNQASSSVFLFTDTNAVDQARFYRVKQ